MVSNTITRINGSSNGMHASCRFEFHDFDFAKFQHKTTSLYSARKFDELVCAHANNTQMRKSVEVPISGSRDRLQTTAHKRGTWHLYANFEQCFFLPSQPDRLASEEEKLGIESKLIINETKLSESVQYNVDISMQSRHQCWSFRTRFGTKRYSIARLFAQFAHRFAD